MVGLHQQLSGGEFEHALCDDDGQGRLECYSLWGRRVGHEQTEGKQQLNNNSLKYYHHLERRLPSFSSMFSSWSFIALCFTFYILKSN